MRYFAMFYLLVVLLWAGQLPGQYSRRRLPSSASATSGPYTGPAVTFNGTVKSISKKEILLDLDKKESSEDPESLTFRFSKKTTFKKGDNTIKAADLEVGMHISLDATRDGDQKLSAVNVIVGGPKGAEQPAAKEDGK
jgi:hypothetical protein